MAEHNKEWFLKELIRLNAFATSASGLAKEIGYTGKTQIYRIAQGTAGDGTIEEVWRRIREEYDLSDEGICEYVNVIGTAKDLWKEVQAKADELSIDEHELAEQTLQALLLHDEQGMRRVLNLPDWECLLDYSREHPMPYAQMIVIYYVLYNNMSHAYKGKIAKEGTALLEGLYQHMQALQPENKMLQEMADAYRSELRQMSGMGNLWTNTLRPALLVQSFTDPDFRINTLSSLRLLPIPTDSLWMEHDTLGRFSGPAFIFMEVEPDGATGGRYDCIEIEATLKDKKFVSKRCFAFWMMEPEAGETHSLAFLQFRDQNGQKQVVRYLYEYDSNLKNLHLEPLDSENPNCVIFPFPTVLHWIDDKPQMLNEERQWMDWYKGFMEANEENIYKEMMRSDGVVLEEDYEIIDVAISRRYLTVTISNGKEVADFRVELEKHPGLQLVKPQMDVAIFMHEDDHKCYLEWISPHVCIPMDAFTKLTGE